MTEREHALTAPPKVEVGMGIRRPREEVFDAFTSGSTLSRFWLGSSDQDLAPSVSVTWTMEAGVEVDVDIPRFVEHELVEFTWGVEDAHRTTVRLEFTEWDHGTMVHVTETGASGSAEEVASWAADSTGGFTMALGSAKAMLEHDLELHAVEDRAPGA